jgi:hypothetical protein
VRCVGNLKTEQCSVITFYCKLGNLRRKLSKTWKGFMEMSVYPVRVCSGGLRGFMTVGSRLRTTPGRDARFPFEVKKTSRKSTVLWTKTEEPQPVWSLTCWTVINTWLATFKKMISGNERLVHVLCRTVCSRRKTTRKQSTVSAISLNSLKTTLTSWCESWRTMRPGAFNTTLRRKDKIWSGDLPGWVRRRRFDSRNLASDNADRFLRHQMNPWQAIRSSGHHSQQPLLFGCLQRLYERVCWVRRDVLDTNSWLLLHDNAPLHCALSVKHFWRRKQSQLLSTLLTCPIWHQRTIFVSENQEGAERTTFRRH